MRWSGLSIFSIYILQHFLYIVDQPVTNRESLPIARIRTVGRPREFDENAALEAVMDVFWSRGYESASLACLCDATGLHKGSLYQAFGDKKQLFLKALHHYSEIEFAEVSSVISEDVSPLTNIHAIVDRICDRFDDNKGCMMINSMTGLSDTDDDVYKEFKIYGAQRLNAITELIEAGQSLGEINPKLSSITLAQELMVCLAGAAATVKAVMDRDEVRSSVHRLVNYWT